MDERQPSLEDLVKNKRKEENEAARKHEGTHNGMISSTSEKGKQMKILVTGNMGHVGPMVAWQLRQSYPTASIFWLDSGFFARCLRTNGGLFPERCVDFQSFTDVRGASGLQLEGIDATLRMRDLA